MLPPLQLVPETLLKNSEIQKILTIGHISITLLVKDYFFPEIPLLRATSPMLCSMDKS